MAKQQSSKPKGADAAMGTLLFLLVLAVLINVVWMEPFEADLASWLRVIGTLAVLVLALVVALVAFIIIVSFVRRALQWNEDYDFRLARKASDEDGAVIRSGPVTFWMTHPADRFQMLEQQLEIVRLRVQELVGESVVVNRPLRVLCFTKKSQFEAYLQRSRLALGNLDGLYQPGWVRRISFHIETARLRPVDYEQLTRLLFGYYFLERYKGFLPNTWLNSGLGRLLAASGQSDDRGRLQRKMLAALAGGRLLNAEQLFHLKTHKLLARFRRPHIHDDFAFIHQLVNQAESVVDYLCGAAAPAERRDRFRAFLKEFGKKDVEAVFSRHFGHGFEQLLRDWQEWVRSQEVGRHEPPPAPIVSALLESTIPFVRDRDNDPYERILAIRDMGNAGYTVGTDALIDVLREDNAELRVTAAWALESISGLAAGQDIARWQSWWDSLPSHVIAAP